MMYIVRWSKVSCVLIIAIFASFSAFGNMIDFNINALFSRYILSNDSELLRGINYDMTASSFFINVMYLLIILLQIISALLCWLGVIYLLKDIRRSEKQFQAAKKYSIIGLSVGFVAWQLALLSAKGENWLGVILASNVNGMSNIFHFFTLILLVLVYLILPEPEMSN